VSFLSKKRILVDKLQKNRCLITPESYEILEDLDDDTIDLDHLLDLLKDEVIITAELLDKAISSIEGRLADEPITNETSIITIIPESQEEIETSKKIVSKVLDSAVSRKQQASKTSKKHAKVKPFTPLGKKIPKKIKILNEASKNENIEGEIEDFQKYFLSRYQQLFKILKQRGDIKGFFRIKDLQKTRLEKNEKVAIIGMVVEKRAFQSGAMNLTIEDPTGRINCLISARKKELLLKASKLLDDQVAAFFGTIYDNRLMINDFVFPDIPRLNQSISYSQLKDPISVCMTSDLHIGSKEFLGDSFNDMIAFLNGKVDDPYQRSLASQIKYLIIGGDVVEGVGVYPNQEDDLLITDIFDQYKKVAELLAKVPEWIHIIIISGNHDACRLALPQPAISRKYAPDLWDMPNVTMLSNPATIELHGKVFLLYHGNSFEDVAALTPGLSMNKPNGPMLYTLRYRHLIPTFGRRTSIVPSTHDSLVINRVPDVYHTGHIHINSHTKYRGVVCVNSGTFQSQTEFMISKNITPTPGRVPIINLQTSELSELRFYHPNEVKQ
jgi:DNA polymerase II small subunit